MGRKPISKSLRFDVFKRDSFTCQYCGQMAPDVVLEIDHINPVANGGDNDILNLVTSCKDCNRGKGAKKLTDNQQIKAQQDQLKELNERREQLEWLLKWRTELSSLEEQSVEIVEEYISSVTGCELSDYGKSETKKLIKKFGLGAVLEATEIAYDKYYISEDTFSIAFNKIGGICFNNNKSKSDPLYGVKSIAASILRNNVRYYDNKRVWNMLNKVVVDEEKAEIIIDIAKRCRNWSDFWLSINDTFESDW